MQETIDDDISSTYGFYRFYYCKSDSVQNIYLGQSKTKHEILCMAFYATGPFDEILGITMSEFRHVRHARHVRPCF